MGFGDHLTSFTFSAVYIMIPSLPITHALGLVAHCPKASRARHLLLYPFKGGKNHTIFQIIAWVFWAASILVAAPVLLYRKSAGMPESHTEILSSAAAVGSMFAELFMIQSLLVFDPVHPPEDGRPGAPTYNRRAIPSKPLAATAVVGLGALWVSMAAALVWATEFLQGEATKRLYIVLSGACLLVGIFITHGVGGKLWHARPRGAEFVTAWRFFQPFKGGAAFVATQALGWALFSSALTSLMWIVWEMVVGVAYCVRCSALGTCCVMCGAYLVLSLSIWTYKVPASPGEAKEQVLAASGRIARLPWAPKSQLWLPILALYTPVHIFSFVVASTFLLLPLRFAAALWVTGLLLYYTITLQGNPQHTGSREWPWLREWLRKHLGTALRAWFGTLEVVYDGQAALSPQQRYVFGYHPHGLFPIGAPYLPLLKEFQDLFPGIHPTPLIASVCFYTPVVRDLCSWCGVRQVSRPSFVRALGERGSVIMVPGGQAELVHTWRFFKRKEFVIYRRHKGFVRLAMQQGAALVPVLCLGEIGCLHNACNWPAMQQWTYKNLGFPIPYLVVGRWGVTPFPRRTGLKFVVGQPIQPQAAAMDGQVDEAEVDRVHARYYAAVEELYHKHSKTFPGCKGVRLVMH